MAGIDETVGLPESDVPQTEEAARYTSSLEDTVAELREANKAATEYARSLEQSRAETQEYARTLAAELEKINSAVESGR